MKGHNKWMVLICGGGVLRLGLSDLAAADKDGWADCFAAEHKAEVVPETEAAYREYAEKHGCKLIHPTLAAYKAAQRGRD